MNNSSFVGREHELELLLESFATHSGGITQVTGQAGIGKSRLLEEFIAKIDKSNTRVVWVHCSIDEGTPPLWPWIQVLRSILDNDQLERLNRKQPGAIQTIAEHLNGFRHLSTGDNYTRSIDSSTQQFMLRDSIRTILDAYTTTQPLVVLIEDIQWLDDSSVKVLELFAQPPGIEQIGFLTSVRLDPFSKEQFRLPHAITGSNKFNSVALSNLSRDETTTLFANLTGTNPSDELAQILWNITEGNPLFIKEFSNTWKPGAQLDSITVPASARETIELRISAIPDNVLEVIEYGSVIGAEFDISRLEAVVKSRSRESLTESLKNAIKIGFVREVSDSPGWFAFAHDVIRQSIYGRMSESSRTQLHAEVAEALEKLGNNPAVDNVAEISVHWQRAGATANLEKSAEWAIAAGKEALNSLSYSSAHSYFEHAKAAAQQVGMNDVEIEGLIGVGESLAPMGRESEATEVLKVAFDRLVAAGHVEKAVQIAEISFTGTEGQLQMVPIYERALDFIDQDSLTAARIQAPLARAVAIEMGDYTRGEELLSRAINTANKYDDKRVESMAAGYGVQMSAFAARFTECLSYCERVMSLQESIDDPYSVSTAGMLLAGFRYEEGRLQEYEALTERTRRSAEKTGNKLRLNSCDMNEIRYASWGCKWARIEELLEQVDFNAPAAERVLAQKIQFLHVTGRTEEGSESLQEFLNLPIEVRRGNESPDAQFFPLMARSTLSPEHFAIVEEAAAQAARNPNVFVQHAGSIARGWIAVEEGDVAGGREVLEELRGAEFIAVERSVVPPLLHLIGEVEAAANALEEFIQTTSARGQYLLEAWARFDYARLLQDHPGVRRSKNALSVAIDARTRALGLGLAPLANRIDLLLEQMGKPRNLFDLTRRELEVLTLITQGMTNKEIADELIVSPHTVNRHLGNLFNKLGVNSRAAATNTAHQHSLI